MNKDFKKFANSMGVSSTTLYGVENSMTPMIIEERELRVAQMSVFDRLMMDRIIWVSSEVEERMASVVQAQLMFLDSIGSKKDITMHLNTPGGSVIDGLGIVDMMNYIKCDVATVNVGMCASMGSVLLSSGTKGKRSSLYYSKVMTHHVSSGTRGTVDDQRISLMESEKFNYLLFKRLAESTGKTFEEIHDDSNRDRWFDSYEALEYGFIDEVIGGGNIKNEMQGFEAYYNKYVLNK